MLVSMLQYLGWGERLAAITLRQERTENQADICLYAFHEHI